MSKRHTSRFSPLLMAICTVIGIMIGTFYAKHFSVGNRLSVVSSVNKINDLLSLISDQYVDEVNIDSIVEAALPSILAELDPHSEYISSNQMELVADQLKGSFSGIGVEFVIRQDTVRVQNVIKNGPAERAGLLAGDKIVSVDGEPFVGKVVTNESTMQKLKGPKDTKVKVGILRYGSSKVKEFDITRGDIPQKSITSTYMVDDHTGYIKIKNFGENTYSDMLIALATLTQNGVDNLIIDLRDNTGGYLQSAVQIANEFLPRNKLIVYTEGRRSPRMDYNSDGHGSYQHIPLVILINEASASASEILAGAMQDNDRATVIGRRSFGKGLVQQQIDFNDRSMLRLTIARYYTPSGRCIQKPYTAGDEADYELDLVNRYNNGEFFYSDSIKHDGKEYHTTKGRVVYGGGGITPDIFVPEDTTDITSYYKEAAMTGLLIQYSDIYTDNNRATLKKLTDCESLVSHLKKQNIVESFVVYAENNGLKRRNLLIKQSHHLLERFLISRIVYTMLDETAWSKYVNADDPVMLESLDILSKGEAFPKAAQDTK